MVLWILGIILVISVPSNLADPWYDYPIFRKCDYNIIQRIRHARNNGLPQFELPVQKSRWVVTESSYIYHNYTVENSCLFADLDEVSINITYVPLDTRRDVIHLKYVYLPSNDDVVRVFTVPDNPERMLEGYPLIFNKHVIAVYVCDPNSRSSMPNVANVFVNEDVLAGPNDRALARTIGDTCKVIFGPEFYFSPSSAGKCIRKLRPYY